MCGVPPGLKADQVKRSFPVRRSYCCTPESVSTPLLRPPSAERSIGTLRYTVTQTVWPLTTLSCGLMTQPSLVSPDRLAILR